MVCNLVMVFAILKLLSLTCLLERRMFCFILGFFYVVR